MRTVLSIVCMISMVVVLSSCNNGGDDGGTAGGRGDFPTVNFKKTTSGGTEIVECYNSDSNVITTDQICIWNCGYYKTSQPRYVKLTFDEALVCNQTGVDAVTGDPTLECGNELALVNEYFAPCVL